MTQPGRPGGTSAQRPATPSPAGGFFNRPGFLGGLFAGFLGAGLLGMLFGHGFLGGLGGFASMLGLMLQIGIVVIIGYLLWTWWQRRNQPALASGPALRNYASPATRARPMGFGGRASAAAAASTRRARSGTDEVGLSPDDFNGFEKLLGDVQAAYSAEDLGAAAPSGHAGDGVLFLRGPGRERQQGRGQPRHDVKLLQGDLAEAWREGDTDYATVAMRYSLNDQMVDRDSGRVVEGGADEATEVWTFHARARRPLAGVGDPADVMRQPQA